jgi:hypothetical protein
MIVLDANKNTSKGKESAFTAAKAYTEVLNEIFLLMGIYGSEEDKSRINEAKTALARLLDSY